MDIIEYLKEKYPNEPKRLFFGAPACIIRHYNPVTYGSVIPDEVNKIFEVDGFFEFFDSKDDEELLTIRNFGRKKLNFLRQASLDYHSDKEKDIIKT